MKIFAVIVVYLIVALIVKWWRESRSQGFESNINNDDEDKDIENDSSENNAEKTQMTLAETIIPLAQKAQTELEANYVLSQNWSDEVQTVLAKTRCFECQKVLINSPKLSGEGLIAICEKPANFNFDNTTVISWFNTAIKDAKLTASQEVRIAKCKEFTIKIALLKRTGLTGEGLVAICQNTGNINVDDSTTVYQWFESAIERTELSEEQELAIAKTAKIASMRALLLRSKIHGKTMVQLCEKTGNLNLDSQIVWNLYETAIQKCKLTVEDEVSIIRSKNFPAQRGLVLSKNLTYEAFLELCRNPSKFNMDHPITKEYFYNATKRLSEKLTAEQKAELAKCKIESVIRGLM